MTNKSVKKRGLGRGLQALLGDIEMDKPMPQGSQASAEDQHIPKSLNSDQHSLPVEMMERGQFQPRRDMDPEALEDLANSIREQGIIQPILVRAISSGRYEILAGERRWRAAQLAGLSDVPVIIRDVPDEAAIAIALIENIQREALNPVEEAVALTRLMTEFTMTHDQVAKAVGKSRSTVSNIMRLLQLTNFVKKLLENGDIEMGHARALLGLEGTVQEQAARQIAAKGLSVREAESLIRKFKSPKSASKTEQRDPDIVRLEQQLSDTLGAKVLIDHSKKGGKVIVQYNDLDELEGILAHIS